MCFKIISKSFKINDMENKMQYLDPTYSEVEAESGVTQTYLNEYVKIYLCH